MIRRAAVWVAVGVAAGGCGDKDPPAAHETTEAPRAAAPASPARPPRPAPIERAQVDALVERWKAAQNRRDFAAYRELYAARMTGIKRVGARVFEYDRDGWLADRERMFRRPMTVGAAGLAVTAADRSAVVRFEQTFAQGRFRDVGPKQMVVVREGSALRIAREEMLESLVVSGRGAGGGEEGGEEGDEERDFHFVLHEGGRSYVLIERAPAVRPVAGSLAAIESRSASHMVVAAVKEAELDGAQRAWRGAQVTLYGAGAPCRAGVSGLALLAGVTPHFGTVASWRGEDGPPLDAAQRAAAVWELAGDDGRLLVGELRPAGASGPPPSGSGQDVAGAGPCAAALWARRGGEPVVQLQDVADAAMSAEVLRAFRQLDGWKAIQADFAAHGAAGDEAGADGDGAAPAPAGSPKSSAPWDEAEGEAPASVTLFRHPQTGVVWAAAGAHTGRGCGDFEAELWAVFEGAGAGPRRRWIRRSDPDSGRLSPEAAFDIDGDGVPELVSPLNLAARDHEGTFGVVEAFSFPYFDCPC